MVDIKFIKDDENAQLPVYSTQEAAGADLYSVEEIVLAPGTNALINTGIKPVIPVGYELQIRPRSGLALKNKITVLNAPGTIDSDYSGLIKVNLINHSKEDFKVEIGARIAQMVVAPVIQCNLSWGTKARDTDRGESGFGSTGV